MSAYAEWVIRLAPAWAREMYYEIIKQLGAIMAAVQIEQGDLDALAAQVESLATTVASIDTTPLQKADQTALDQAVADLQTAVQKVAPPPPPPPPTA